MKKYKFTIRGNVYEVEVNSFEENIVNMEVNGTTYNVEVHKEMKTSKTPQLVRATVPEPTRKEKKIRKNIKTGSMQIKSPLPGTIMKIMVNEGDTIKFGDTLMIMEAMKMENNVLAEKSGVVKSIKVREGDAVLQNDVLIEIN